MVDFAGKTFGFSVLETADLVNVEIVPLVVQSSALEGLILTRFINRSQAKRRVFRLAWSPASKGIAQSVERHFMANVNNSFDYLTESGQKVLVIYAETPSIGWSTDEAATVAVALEETLY